MKSARYFKVRAPKPNFISALNKLKNIIDTFLNTCGSPDRLVRVDLRVLAKVGLQDLKGGPAQYLKKLGSSCSPAVEHMPHDRDVGGLNPAGCWAFFS